MDMTDIYPLAVSLTPGTSSAPSVNIEGGMVVVMQANDRIYMTVSEVRRLAAMLPADK